VGESTSTGVSGLAAPASPPPWWARRVGFGWIAAVTGFFSLVAAGVLVGERIQLYLDADSKASCDWGGAFSCTSVMKSSQAAAFGFPNPFIGLVGFTIVIVVGVTLIAGASLPRWFWIAFQAGITLAFGFLVWLYTQAVYSISALCIYCMICWLMMTYLFFLALARNVLTGVFPAPAWLRAWASGWAWVTATVVVIACAASIFVHFAGLLLS